MGDVVVDDVDEAAVLDLARLAATVDDVMAEPWFVGLGMADGIEQVDELIALLETLGAPPRTGGAPAE